MIQRTSADTTRLLRQKQKLTESKQEKKFKKETREEKEKRQETDKEKKMSGVRREMAKENSVEKERISEFKGCFLVAAVVYRSSILPRKMTLCVMLRP